MLLQSDAVVDALHLLFERALRPFDLVFRKELLEIIAQTDIADFVTTSQLYAQVVAVTLAQRAAWGCLAVHETVTGSRVPA
jgi:hypothetical protein